MTNFFKVATKRKVLLAGAEPRHRLPLQPQTQTTLAPLQLEGEKRKLYKGDKLEALFVEFRSKALPFKDYAVKICEEFGKGEEELLKTMSDMTNVNQTISAANAKFGFHKVLR